MTNEEQQFKTGRQRQASYATICQWIVDAWAKVSVSSITRSSRKAGIITEPSNSNGINYDSDNAETKPSMLDAETAQLFNSDSEDKDFNGFVVEALSVPE